MPVVGLKTFPSLSCSKNLSKLRPGQCRRKTCRPISFRDIRGDPSINHQLHAPAPTPPTHFITLFLLSHQCYKAVESFPLYSRCYSRAAVRASGCVCRNRDAMVVVTHRCRSCCRSAGRTSGGSRTLVLCLCPHTYAGSHHFHSYRSLKTAHTLKSYFSFP